VCIAFAHVNGQTIDKTFCDSDTLPVVNPQVPFPLVLDLTIQYEMSIEINSGASKRTSELDQYFDGTGNQAVDIFTDNGITTRIYTYDKNDEVLIIIGDICIVQKASQQSLSPVPSIAVNASYEHIISPLQLLALQAGSVANLKIAYIGKSVVKGVSVNQWQLCNFIESTKITQKITYSLSDPSMWTIAMPTPNVTVVPVEVKIENKATNNSQWIDTYSITKFRPYINILDNVWVTPSGSYCQGRTLGPRPPKVPEVFSFRASIVTPVPLSFDLFGAINNIYEIHDSKNNIYRIDYANGVRPISEIHDYKTGLRYIIDRYGGNCTIGVIDPGSPEAQTVNGFVTLKNSSSLFFFDDTDFYYTGFVRINHINTQRWIGRRLIGNTTATFEWYFLAPGYFQNEGTEIRSLEPVRLIVTFYKEFLNPVTQQIDYLKTPVYYNFYNFDESGLDTFAFNFAVCYDKYPKSHWYFEIQNSDQYRDIMEAYKTNLKLGVLIGITASVAVFPTRIVDLELDFNRQNVVVLFTILDKAPFYGPVNITRPEVELSDANALLNATVAAGKLFIPFVVDSNTFFELVADPNSLRRIERRTDGTAFITKETITLSGYSSGQVGGIAFGILVLGLVAGMVAGVFVCIYRPNTLPLDKINDYSPIDKISGFINPLFKNARSDA